MLRLSFSGFWTTLMVLEGILISAVRKFWIGCQKTRHQVLWSFAREIS